MWPVGFFARFLWHNQGDREPDLVLANVNTIISKVHASMSLCELCEHLIGVVIGLGGTDVSKLKTESVNKLYEKLIELTATFP